MQAPITDSPTAPGTQLPAIIPTLTAAIRPPTSHGRIGKIARLPKSRRDEVNTMIQDGVPYLKIIEYLGPDGEDLNEQNLSNWRAGGYLDWTRQQQLAQVIHTKHELAQSIVARSGDDNDAGSAVLQILATSVCEFLVDTDPITLRDSLLSDCDKFTRFVNAMVRLAEGSIKCGLFRFRSHDRAAQAAKQKTPAEKPGVSDESLHTAEEKLNLL